MEGIGVEYFSNSFYSDSNETKSVFYSYIIDENEKYACDSYAHMFHLLKNSIKNITVSYVNSLGRHQWLGQAI